jgi:hypothetical protein
LATEDQSHAENEQLGEIGPISGLTAQKAKIMSVQPQKTVMQ